MALQPQSSLGLLYRNGSQIFVEGSSRSIWVTSLQLSVMTKPNETEKGAHCNSVHKINNATL
jgi:hypothetical protein